AIERVERLYDGEKLPATFQVSPAARPSGLDRLLDARGYRMRSSTSVEVAEIGTVLGRLPRDGHTVAVAESPDEEWMDLWWSVDGRGDSGKRKTAHEILTSAPALYVSSRDATGTTAVGRLALVVDWGGLYCMAVRPDARRRGLATAVLRALLSHASESGTRHVWLQVVADNSAARALYSRAGFVPVSSYHYRVRPMGSASTAVGPVPEPACR
ncbi:GNAT family N-acetyltransferase, partial [Actinomadura adrarensis]